MTALVTRPDLSARTILSKSALTVADLCGSKAWFDIHDRRPLIPAENITFGSAVDAGVEQILTMRRAGMAIDERRSIAAAAEVIASLVDKPTADKIIPSVLDDRLVPSIASVIA